MFSEKETTYLKSQKLARIATVSKGLQPDVAPVGFEFDGTAFYIGGLNNPSTLKYKNIAQGNTKVALVIDDLASVDPWQPRFVKVHGTAEIVSRVRQLSEGEYIRITPTVTWSFGIEAPPLTDGKPIIKKTSWKSGTSKEIRMTPAEKSREPMN